MSEARSLFRPTIIMGVGTVFSRITGLLRNLLLVAALGTALLGDTYNVANTMPNILYNLFVGGALTSVFVPQIIRSIKEERREFISGLTRSTIFILVIITLLGVCSAPILVRMYSPDFIGRPEYSITLTFMRYCLPQIFFMGMFALLSQIANALNRFGPMMWAPIVNNLCAISLFSFFIHVAPDAKSEGLTHHQIALLGLGTTFGYALQALVMIPYVRSIHFSLRYRVNRKDPELRKSLRLALGTLIFAFISQCGYLVTVNLATRAGVTAHESGITTGVGFTPFSNAYLIFLIPHSVLTISVVTALLPKLSHHVFDRELEIFSDLTNRVLRIIIVVTIPCTLYFITFGKVLSQSIFLGISHSDSLFIGKVLIALSFGLLPMSCNLVLLRALNAFEDIKRQVIGNALANLVAIFLSLLFFNLLPSEDVTIGLAAATSLSMYVGVYISFRQLKKHEINLKLGSHLRYALRVSCLGLVSIIPVLLVANAVAISNLATLLISLILCPLLFLIVGLFGNIYELRTLITSVRGKLGHNNRIR